MYATGSRNRTTETATENEANASQSHVHVASSLSHSHFLTFLCLLESPYIHCNIESIFGHRQRQRQHYRRALQLHLPLDLQSWRDFLSLTLSLAHSLPFSHLLFLSFSPTLLFLYQLLQTHTDWPHYLWKNETVVFEVIFETEHTFTCTTENTTVIVIIVQCKETAANNNKWVLCTEREYGYIDAERLTKWSQTIIVYYCHTNLWDN